MRSGKDSVAAEIIKQRSGQYDIRRYAFADALKQEVNDMAKACGGMRELFLLNPLLPQWVEYDPVAPMDDPLCPLGKQRSLLQFWGVYRREQEQDYWVNKVAQKLEEEKPEICLITDLRFMNEFLWAKEYGDTIRVDRPGLPLGTHVSETSLACLADSEWDAVIANCGTLAELKRKALITFDKLMEEPQ